MKTLLLLLLSTGLVFATDAGGSNEPALDAGQLQAMVNLLTKEKTALVAKVKSLQDDNDGLRGEVKLLRAQVDAQQTEITALKTQLKAKNGDATGQKSTTVGGGTVSYRGAAKTPEWVDLAFKQYGPDIATFDGKFYDVGKALLARSKRGHADQMEILPHAQPPEIGAAFFVFSGARVLQVLSDHEVIAVIKGGVYEGVASYYRERDTTLYINGLDAKALTDDVFLTGPKGALETRPLVYVGPHTYQSTDGARRTIPGYALPRPVTKEEFATALNGGLVLHTYEAVKNDKTSVDVTGKKETKIWYDIIEKEVPATADLSSMTQDRPENAPDKLAATDEAKSATGAKAGPEAKPATIAELIDAAKRWAAAPSTETEAAQHERREKIAGEFIGRKVEIRGTLVKMQKGLYGVVSADVFYVSPGEVEQNMNVLAPGGNTTAKVKVPAATCQLRISKVEDPTVFNKGAQVSGLAVISHIQFDSGGFPGAKNWNTSGGAPPRGAVHISITAAEGSVKQ